MKSIIQNIRNEGKIRAGYISAFFLLLVSFLLTFYANRRLIDNAKLVNNTNDVISRLVLMLSHVKDAEIGARGFMVTGKDFYLQPYFGSRKATDSMYRKTREVLKNNPVQLKRLEQVKQNVDKKYNFIEITLKSIIANNGELSTEGMASMNDAKLMMDTIRTQVAVMQDEEKTLLIQRDRNLKTTSDLLISIVIASIIIAFFLVVFGYYAHLKENKERVVAEEKIKNYQDELNNRIEELATANEQLIKMRSQEKLAATGRIARTIAHEIRNPLTNINLAAEQLSTEMTEDDENTSFLFEMINRNSSRINQLITDLLSSTKFTELNFEKVSVNDLLDEALSQAKDRILLNHVEVKKDYANDICDISIDKEKIRIAFLNLIINAIEAMESKQDATLTLVTRNKGDYCEIEIADNGTGMDEEAMNRLFEPYFTSKPKGNGLGLTNTQNIILNHKGDIDVKSEVDRGTSFFISLSSV